MFWVILLIDVLTWLLSIVAKIPLIDRCLISIRNLPHLSAKTQAEANTQTCRQTDGQAQRLEYKDKHKSTGIHNTHGQTDGQTDGQAQTLRQTSIKTQRHARLANRR